MLQPFYVSVVEDFFHGNCFPSLAKPTDLSLRTSSESHVPLCLWRLQLPQEFATNEWSSEIRSRSSRQRNAGMGTRRSDIQNDDGARKCAQDCSVADFSIWTFREPMPGFHAPITLRLLLTLLALAGRSGYKISIFLIFISVHLGLRSCPWSFCLLQRFSGIFDLWLCSCFLPLHRS